MTGTRSAWKRHIHAAPRAMRSPSATLTATSSLSLRICLKRQKTGATRRWCAFKSRWFLFLALPAPRRRYAPRSVNTPSSLTSLATLLRPPSAAFLGPISSRSLALLVLASWTLLASSKHPKSSECASANGLTSVDASQRSRPDRRNPLRRFFLRQFLADHSTPPLGSQPLTLNSAPNPRVE